jgi:hypothetical protein
VAIPDTVAAHRVRPVAVAPRVTAAVVALRATVAADIQPRLLMAAVAPRTVAALRTAAADHTVADRTAEAATVGIANDIPSAPLN